MKDVTSYKMQQNLLFFFNIFLSFLLQVLSLPGIYYLNVY